MIQNFQKFLLIIFYSLFCLITFINPRIYDDLDKKIDSLCLSKQDDKEKILDYLTKYNDIKFALIYFNGRKFHAYKNLRVFT